MKALICSLLSAFVLVGSHNPSNAQTTECYITVDFASAKILEGVNAEKKTQIGSITKVATALVVLDWAELQNRDLSEMAVVPPSALTMAEPGSNPIGFQPGDAVSLRDLIYAALLQSDNIASLTLAWHVGKTLSSSDESSTPIDRFVAQMNALARRLKMSRTLFVNPHGLDATEAKLPYSTAADVARLCRYAMERASFRFFVSQKERRINITHVEGGLASFSLANTNELLGYNGVDGVKTGRTRRAGDCVVISAARAPESRQEGETFIVTPRRLIVVVLGSEARFPRASQLLESGWKLHQSWEAAGRPVLKKNQTL